MSLRAKLESLVGLTVKSWAFPEEITKDKNFNSGMGVLVEYIISSAIAELEMVEGTTKFPDLIFEEDGEQTRIEVKTTYKAPFSRNLKSFEEKMNKSRQSEHRLMYVNYEWVKVPEAREAEIAEDLDSEGKPSTNYYYCKIAGIMIVNLTALSQIPVEPEGNATGETFKSKLTELGTVTTGHLIGKVKGYPLQDNLFVLEKGDTSNSGKRSK